MSKYIQIICYQLALVQCQYNFVNMLFNFVVLIFYDKYLDDHQDVFKICDLYM